MVNNGEEKSQSLLHKGTTVKKEGVGVNKSVSSGGKRIYFGRGGTIFLSLKRVGVFFESFLY